MMVSTTCVSHSGRDSGDQVLAVLSPFPSQAFPALSLGQPSKYTPGGFTLCFGDNGMWVLEAFPKRSV